MFDCPTGKRITAEVNAQIKGLSEDQAFDTLTKIITEQVDKVDEATVRVSYAYHRIEHSKLWTTRFTSEGEWKSSLGRDVDAINHQGRRTIERINGYAKLIRENWNVALETITENPSRGLAEEISRFSSICPDTQRALELIRSCNLRRQQDEPGDRGPGVSRTKRLLPGDVRKAISEYIQAEATHFDTSQHPHPIIVPLPPKSRQCPFEHPTTRTTSGVSEHIRAELKPVETSQNQTKSIISEDRASYNMHSPAETRAHNAGHLITPTTSSASKETRAMMQISVPITSVEATLVKPSQNQIKSIINEDSARFDMPYSHETQLTNFAHLATQSTAKSSEATQAMRRMSEPILSLADPHATSKPEDVQTTVDTIPKRVRKSKSGKRYSTRTGKGMTKRRKEGETEDQNKSSISLDESIELARTAISPLNDRVEHFPTLLADNLSHFRSIDRNTIEAMGTKRQTETPDPRFRKRFRAVQSSNSYSPSPKSYTPLGEIHSSPIPAFASETSSLCPEPLASPITNTANTISPSLGHEQGTIPSSSPTLSTVFQLPIPDELTDAHTLSSTLPTQPTIGAFKATVNSSSLHALQRGEMINDSIIMAILGLRDTSGCVVVDPLTLASDQEARPAPSSHRRTVARESGLIIVPYHNEAIQHWSLFIARTTIETLEHIDSYLDQERTKHEAEKVCKYINWLTGEDVRWKQRDVQVTESISNDYQRLANQYQQSAQQTNGVDCGIYLIANASAVMECSPLPDNIDAAALRLTYARQIEKTLKPQTAPPHSMIPLGRGVPEKDSTINQAEAEIHTAISQIIRNHMEASTNKTSTLKESAEQAKSTYVDTRKEVIITYNERMLLLGEKANAMEALVNINNKQSTCRRLREDLAGPLYENVPDIIGQMLTIAEKESEQYTEEAKKKQLDINRITEQLRATSQELSVARQRCVAAEEARANAVAALKTATSDMECLQIWAKSEYPTLSNRELSRQ